VAVLVLRVAEEKKTLFSMGVLALPRTDYYMKCIEMPK
jgi:hypothetical protein